PSETMKLPRLWSCGGTGKGKLRARVSRRNSSRLAGTQMAGGLERHSGASASSGAGSITAPESACAPTDAPFSSRQTVRSGLSCLRRMAHARPPGPAPTIATSYSITSRSGLALTLVSLMAGSPEHIRRPLHTKYAVALGLRLGAADREVQREAEHAPRVERIYHAVVPQASRRVVGMSLRFVLRADLLHERLLLALPGLTARPRAVAAHGCEHLRGLLAAHDRDARVRPHPQKARAVGTAAHCIVARSEGAADDHRELRNRRARDGGHHFRAVFRDAGTLVAAAHHEAGDVLQEQQRDAPAVRELDEVRSLQRGL